LQHGAGDPRWFYKLDPDAQADILALDRAEAQEAEEARKKAEAKRKAASQSRRNR
jgi:hypothetical protein